MAQAPYIPAKNADFLAWLNNFSALLTTAPTTYGLTAPDAVTVATQQLAFANAFAVADAPGTRTSASIAARDAARALAEAIVRPYAIAISLNAAVTNGDKVAIGVIVRIFPPTPIPAPTTNPALILVAATPLQHELQFRDSATPLLKAKPFGVAALELVASIGIVAATDPAQCAPVASYTKTPFRVSFQSGDRGKLCTYFARWRNASGPGGVAAVGPWSPPVTIGVI